MTRLQEVSGVVSKYKIIPGQNEIVSKKKKANKFGLIFNETQWGRLTIQM